MDVLHTVAELRDRLRGERAVVLVPTMGGLHEGHVSLVKEARKHGDCVVTSVFVNRLQFEPGGDFDRYPRTLENDCRMLEAAGCDVVFAPDERQMYPEPQEMVVMPPKVAATLEGEFRPGHFQGVATVVAKLFNIVAPHTAIFGLKDFQQCHVVRALEKQLNFGIRIVGAPTIRDPDGLAMSSRNAYLTREERAQAAALQQNLRRIKALVEGGRRDYDALVQGVVSDLTAAGWRVDYVAVRNRSALAVPGPGDKDLVILAAAWLGKTRLIDNLEADL
ncbi:pantoate--beta-alanine ligase [Usitatibacter palustris]|uniref:Pantothenate synthetase n=1 Tax=Usitatibacter palustris TaxID=2732487 RepID=A0A6M4H366_9PROT|nr:pantoate--beta-alanine ligase [Usitatibacter palustris]QJR14031.1 Pantothenate synthetase [Usitatibacter palustris]